MDLRLWAALASVYVIWGSTYFAMRVAVAGLPPLGMGAIRFVAAGGMMIVVGALRSRAWPSWRDWWTALPIGVLLCVGGNGFVAISLGSIGSGVAAVVCATMPLWTAVLASLTGERASGREWLGLAVGFAGVVILIGGASVTGEPAHYVFLVLSPLSWAVGSLLARRVRIPSGVTGSGLQMVTGGAALAVVALLRGERLPAEAPAEAWLAVLYLAVLGSLVAFTAYGWLLRNARPAVATSYAYVNPAIAVLIGAFLGNEPIGATTLIATGLIIAAVVLVVSRRK